MRIRPTILMTALIAIVIVIGANLAITIPSYTRTIKKATDALHEETLTSLMTVFRADHERAHCSNRTDPLDAPKANGQTHSLGYLALRAKSETNADDVIFVLSTNGNLVWHSKKDVRAKSIQTAPYMKKILAEERGSITYRDESGTFYKAFFAPFQEWGWIVALSTRVEREKEAFLNTVVTQVGVSLGILIITILILYFLTTRVFAPLGSVVHRANEISEGNIDVQPIGLSGNDEVGLVATAFDKMLSKLKLIIKGATIGSESTDELLDKIVNTALEVTNSKRGFLFILSKKTKELELRYAKNIENAKLETVLCIKEIAYDVFARGKSIWTNHLESDPEFGKYQINYLADVSSALCMPFEHHGERMGIFYLDSNTDCGLSENDLELLQVFLSQAKIAIENNELQSKAIENALTLKEMEIAKNIQTSLLPEPAEYRNDLFDISAQMIPASDVGGDYFDILRDPDDNIWFAIGDVTGHGLISGLIMIMTQVSIGTIIHNIKGVTPENVLVHANRMIYSNIRKRMKVDQHITLNLLVSKGEGRIEYAGAHEFILIYRKRTKTVEHIKTKGMWLGIIYDISKMTGKGSGEFTMEPGDICLLYTDGVIEIRNTLGEQFDIKRLCEFLKANCEKTSEMLKYELLHEIERFQGKMNDDISYIFIKRNE